MPVGIEDMLPPLAPSASLDGLDLTPAEIRALSPEMFVRVFTLLSFDHVPAVGSGHLGRRPPGAAWWLRFRAAPDPADPRWSGGPGPKHPSKVRKAAAWQL